MFENKQTFAVGSATDIRIVRLNTDKTRRMIGTDAVYQDFFETSGIPPTGWISVFEQEWKALNAGRPMALQETTVDRAFLVIPCPLKEISGHLPILKKAVDAANISFRKYERRQAAVLKEREGVWKYERRAVKDAAKSLHFD